MVSETVSGVLDAVVVSGVEEALSPTVSGVELAVGLAPLEPGLEESVNSNGVTLAAFTICRSWSRPIQMSSIQSCLV